ncbi:MAG: hypothetical protein V5A62_01250 [Haloarculaceae archaeon]
MSELSRDLASAPSPGVLPGTPATTVAYTDFRRDESGAGVAPWPRHVSVTAARLDGYGRVELLELDDRGTTGGRAFLAAVGAWERVADHDHVAPVVGSGKRPRPWVATVGDPTLADRADAELAPTLWIGVCLAGAFAYAHDEGVLHGAVTPGRVRLHPTPEWPFPRLCGFGLARLLAEGTDAPARAAPEQVAPEPHHGAGTATDVYGLALTLYEALTGDLPYVSDDPRAVLESTPVPPSTVEPTLPTAVDDLLLPALAKDPVDRPGLDAFRDDLVALLAAESPESADDGGSGTGTATPATDSSFPFLDGARADWRTACPSCGRSVTNTLAAFRAHWRDAGRCDGPPERPPIRADHSREDWARIVESVESAPDTASTGTAGTPGNGNPNHPLWTALAEGRVVEVGGVAVASADGTYPWLSYPRRGWRVPCPVCGSTVFNAETAMKAHWSDAPDCSGPPDDFETA